MNTYNPKDLLTRIQPYAFSSKFYERTMTIETTQTTKNVMTERHQPYSETVVSSNKVHKAKENIDQDCNTSITVTTKDNSDNTKASTSTSTPDTYNVNSRDKLFWCLIMAVRDWEEADLPEKRERFLIETTEKTRLTEILQKTDDVPWKELKLSRTSICSALGASINNRINVDILRVLSFVYKKNIVYLWGKGCCLRINGARAASTDSHTQKWHVIFRKRSGYSLASDEHATEIMKQVDSGIFYMVDDPNKPLLSISVYKIGELQEIAKKLDVSIMRDDVNKPKIKKDLYQDIIDAIHKID